MKKKNIFMKAVCAAMICGMIMISTQLAQAETIKGYVEEPSEEEMVSYEDFMLVDKLIEQRVDALTEGDMDRYRELTEELEKHGCKDVPFSEVVRLTGTAQ